MNFFSHICEISIYDGFIIYCELTLLCHLLKVFLP